MDVGALLLLAAAALELAQQYAPQPSAAPLRAAQDRYPANPAVASAPAGSPFDPYAGGRQLLPPSGATPQLQGSAPQSFGPQALNAETTPHWFGPNGTSNGSANNPTAQGLFERTRQQVRDALGPVRDGAKQMDAQLGEFHDNVTGRARQVLDALGRPLADAGYAGSMPPQTPWTQQPPLTQQPPQSPYPQRPETIAPNADYGPANAVNSQNGWGMTPPHLLTPGLPPNHNARPGNSSPYVSQEGPFNDRRDPAYDQYPANDRRDTAYDQFSANPGVPGNAQQAPQQPFAFDNWRDQSGVQEGQSPRRADAQPDASRSGRRTISHPISPDQVGNWQAGSRTQPDRYENVAGRSARAADRSVGVAGGTQLPAGAAGPATTGPSAPGTLTDGGSAWPGADPRRSGFGAGTGASPGRDVVVGNGPQLPTSQAGDARPLRRGELEGQQRSNFFADDKIASNSDIPVVSGAMLKRDPSAPLDLSEAREVHMAPDGRLPGDRVGNANQWPEFPSPRTSNSPSATTWPPQLVVPDPVNEGNDLARDADRISGAQRNPFAILLAWVLLSGSAMGNFYLFWSYMDVRTKYRALARRSVGGVGQRVSPI